MSSFQEKTTRVEECKNYFYLSLHSTRFARAQIAVKTKIMREVRKCPELKISEVVIDIERVLQNCNTSKIRMNLLLFERSLKQLAQCARGQTKVKITLVS